MEDSLQLNTHLHFDAYIHISCFADRKNFYLYSNGISFRNIMALSAYDGPVQITKALFRIVPPIKFQSQSFLQKILKQRYKESKGQQIEQKQAKVFIDQFDLQLKENKSFIQQQRRFHIKYGQPFMLQHKHSCKYVCYVKNEQNNEYSLQITEVPNHNSVFNLQPCFNYQKDMNTYIPFNSSAYLSMKIIEGLQLRQLYLNFNLQSVFNPWTTSQQEKQQITVGIYQTGEEIQYKNICYGDSVWIFHLQTGSFVKTVSKRQKHQAFMLDRIKYVLGYMKQSEPQQENPKILLQKAQNEMSAEKFGLWQIIYANGGQDQTNNRKAHKDRFKGGKVKFDHEVRFFNYRYQTFLSVVKKKIGRKKFIYEITTQKQQELNTIFKIKPLSANSIYATTQDLFLIQNVETKTYLTLQSPFGVGEQSTPLTPSESFKKEDNFKFSKIQFIQQWQNNYILSILPFLHEGVNAFKLISDGKMTRKQELILKILCQNLIQLLTFSYDLTQGFQASQSKLGKMTYNHYQVQKLLKQQGIIHALLQLLNNIDVKYVDQNSTVKQSLKIQGALRQLKNFSQESYSQAKLIPLDPLFIKKIVNVIFKILRNIFRFNSENCMYLKQQMETFIKFLSLGTFAQRCIIQSLTESDALQKITIKQFKMINQQYKLAWQLKKKYFPQFFLLMKLFLKNNNSSINKNQMEIFKITLQEKNPLIIPIYTKNNQFYIGSGGQAIQLRAFTLEYPSEVETLNNQLKFYADLTFDRNYVCSKRIKQILPIHIMIKYLYSDINVQIKEGFIQVINHTYLNERPRFKDKKPFIYTLHEIYTKDRFTKSFQKGFRRNSNAVKQDQFQYQMQMMRKQGITEDGILEILSCIKQQDYLNYEDLASLKSWIKSQINKSIQSGQQFFYTAKMQSCLISLLEMSQLSIFDNQQTQEVQKIITDVIQQMGKSLQLINYNVSKLESKNFKQLLLEMVEKNVIKKSAFQSKFDGVEDEIVPDNICSLFVNYSFYQNILLLEKNPKRRRQTDQVIQIILKLVSLYNKIMLEEILKNFVGSVIENQPVYRDSQQKQELIRKIIIQEALSQPMKNKQNLFRLLLLLFYNSNSYKINFAAINLVLQQVFEHHLFMNSLEKILFVVDRQEKETYKKLLHTYKDIRLLIQTAQIWFPGSDQSPQYNTVLHYFTDKMRLLFQIVVPGFHEQLTFDTLAGAQQTIKIQYQIMLSNLEFEQEILDFLTSYKLTILKIKQQNQRNKLYIQLVKSCFMFLYIFIYNCPQNKQIIRIKLNENISKFFSEYNTIQFGQTNFLVQYLRDNYQECIQFYQYNNDSILNFQKKIKYIYSYSKLFVTLMKYHNDPINVNLKKFFVNIFDFNSFKNFMWLPNGKEFNLNLQQFIGQNENQSNASHPFFYHINAIQAILILQQYLPESSNAIRSHLKKSLTQKYLYQLLQLPDYFSHQQSRRTILKVTLLFKLSIKANIVCLFS